MIILRSENTWVARWLDGNYAMYEKDRKQRLGIEPDRPLWSEGLGVTLRGQTTGTHTAFSQPRFQA